MAGKTVAVTQSNYIPWRGYFDTIARCDHVVLLDDVQYTKRDWRNRNQIKTPQGKKWLSIPVKSKGKHKSMRICEARVETQSWAQSHLSTLLSLYRKAPCYEEVKCLITPLYDKTETMDSLSQINRLFIEAICGYMCIETTFSWSWDHFSLSDLDSFDSSRRILKLCQAVGATDYLSGPAAKAYMKLELFQQVGIAVHWADYSGLKVYDQLYGDFDGAVSIIDYLFMQKVHGTAEIGQNHSLSSRLGSF